MPRKGQLSEIELKICRRLKETRERFGVERGFLARAIGIDLAALKRIELGRVPLKYGPAVKVMRYLGVNPVWLATNKGPDKPYLPLPSADTLGVSENANFIEVFNEHLSKYLSSEARDESISDSSVFERYRLALILEVELFSWFRDVADGRVQLLDQAIRKAAKHLLQQMDNDDWARVMERRAMFYKLLQSEPSKQSDADWVDFLEKRKSGQHSKSSNLTEAATTDTTSDVKLLLPNLLKRLNELTSESGKKSELAKFLGAPLASVSRWLSGDREPGGEIALKMLYWAERQQPK